MQKRLRESNRSCGINRSLPCPATKSVTSQTSLNLAHIHDTTQQPLQDKSTHDAHHADAAYRRRHRHQRRATQRSLVLRIHVCTLRYQEFNKRYVCVSGCQMKRSLPFPDKRSITSQTSTNATLKQNSSSHLSCTFTSAFIDMRSSTMAVDDPDNV